MDKEASSIISVVTAFLIAAFGLAAAFGLDIGDAQRTAILAVVGPTVAVVLLAGQILRQYVWSLRSTQAAADAAYQAGKAGQPQPPLTAQPVPVTPVIPPAGKIENAPPA